MDFVFWFQVINDHKIFRLSLLIYTLGCSSAFSQGQSQMVEDLNSTEFLGEVALGMYIIGYSLSPIFLAPFSEELGRQVMYYISYSIYVLMFIPLALATNIETVIICRFIQGLFPTYLIDILF